MLRFLFFIVPAIFFLGISQPAFPQQQQESTENSLLPDIDTQDIEIRSQFKARFPGLRRQPILGFDTSPKIYQIDPDRLPFMESRGQAVANLSVSELSRPAPPDFPGRRYAPDISAFGRLGVGSYTSPEAQFWGVHRINKKSYVGGDLDFSSSDGHFDDQDGSFRFLDAHSEFATKLDKKTQLDLAGGLQSDFNHLFELNGAADGSGTPRKSYTGFNIGAGLKRFQNTIQGWNASAGYRYFKTDLDAGELSGAVNESVYNGSVTKQWAGSNINETFTIKAFAKGGSYDFEDGGERWTTLRGGAEYQRLFNYTTQITADASVYYATDAIESKVYFGPSLKLDHTFGNALKIIGKIEGKPYIETIEQHHEINRFLNAANELQHTYSVDVSGEAILEYYRGSTLRGGISYMNATNYAYYARPESENNFYNLNYMDATNLKIYAGITHQLLPERFWISAEAYAQNPKLENDEEIPFHENLGLNVGASVRPIDRIVVEAWADYVGSRETGTGGKIDGFLLVGGQLDVEITKRFGAYVKLVNLLGENYEIWQGYRERPLQFYGGLTIQLD